MGSRAALHRGRFRWLAAAVAVGFLAAAPAPAADIELLEAVAAGAWLRTSPSPTTGRDTRGRAYSATSRARSSC